MRFLILSTFLACASAAPSGVLAPVAISQAIPVAGPLVPLTYSIIPTISPGDIQAAAIDAQVKAQDNAIAAVDKARELSELAVKNLNEKVEVNNDQIKEKVEEQFWSTEDKKWQAIDALKTAEAQIDGSIANNAEALAKSAITPYLVVAPAVGLAPVHYTHPGIVAPVLRTAEVKEVTVKTADVKAAEPSDSIAVEAEKTGEKVLVKNIEDKTVVASAVAPLPLVEPLKHSIIAPGVISPLLKTGAVPYGTVPYVQTVGLVPQTILAPQIRLAPQIGLTPQIDLAQTVYKTW